MAIGIFVFISIVVCLYVSWNIGANDVANAVSTSVGSKVISYSTAVLIAALFELIGAVFAGDKVVDTLGTGLLNMMFFNNDVNIMLKGFLSILIAMGLCVQTATVFGFPISSSHAMVGAILGFGGYVGGVQAIKWNLFAEIVMYWILSPVMAAIIAVILSRFFQTHLFSDGNVTIYRSKCIVFIVMNLIIFIISKSMISMFVADDYHVRLSSGIFTLLLSTGLFLYRVFPIESNMFNGNSTKYSVMSESLDLKKLGIKRRDFTEKTQTAIDLLNEYSSVDIPTQQKIARHTRKTAQYIFGSIQWMSIAFISFAHGANDVANSMGPMSVILNLITQGNFASNFLLNKLLLLVGGLSIVVGIISFGWKVVKTMGTQILPLTPIRAFSAELSVAVTVLLANVYGIPVSTTHALVGALLGISTAYKVSNVNLRVICYILISWIAVVPVSAGLVILIFRLLNIPELLIV